MNYICECKIVNFIVGENVPNIIKRCPSSGTYLSEMTPYRGREESLPLKKSCQRAAEWEQKMKPILTQEEVDALLHGLSEDESKKDHFYSRLRAKILGPTKTLREWVFQSKTENYPGPSRHPHESG